MGESSKMVKSEAFEFPFVEQLPKLSELPKREQSKLQRVWDRFKALSAITEEKGMLVPVRLAAKILDVSRQRCDELITAGKLECIDVDGHRFVTESSVLAYATSERQAGRPPKVLTEAESKGVTRAAMKVVKDWVKDETPRKK